MMRAFSLAVGLLVAGSAFAASTEQIAQLDSLWLQRNKPEVAQTLEKAHRDALRSAPQDFDLLWRAARERAWVADAALDPRLKKAAGMEAWKFAEQAMALNPTRVEGHYYSAIGIGAHADGSGPMKALSMGLAQKFVAEMQKAAQIDASFDRGGPLLALGRYNAVIPWPVRDTKQAEKLYNEVRERFPENLRATHYLAQLKLSQNDKASARALVEQVKQGPSDYDPAEAERVKTWAGRTEQQLGQ